MQQIQIPYKNSPDFLNKLLQLKNYYEDNSLDKKELLFYINWSGDVKGKLSTLIDKIEEIFPDAQYYGNEGSGNIVTGDYSSGINVTCYIFECQSTKADVIWVEKGTKTPSLNAVWNICNNKKNLKGVEMISTYSYLEYLKLDKEQPPINENVIIFGGVAAQYNYPSEKSYVLAKGHGKSTDAMVVVLFSGENVSISLDYILGFQPVGRIMQITEVEGKCIKKADNKSPKELFEMYLGPLTSLQETYVFPLYIVDNGYEFLRIPRKVNEDGTMEMYVEIPKDVNFRISYGDRNTIINQAQQKATKITEFRPEAIKAYSCATRRMFWGDITASKETKLFDQIAPVCGFYSDGIFLKIGDKIRLCNETLSIASIREYNGKDIKPVQIESEEIDKSMASRLAYFTKKVTQEQEEAIKLAEEANNAKTRFLFNMSHDIRTPMNAILGFTNIAVKEINNNPEKSLEAIQKVQNSSEILLSIINDILDMSRIESGKTTIKYETINVCSILDKIEPIMFNLAAPKDINITFNTIHLEHKFVSTDVTFVQRILINIISNAIKYTNGGGNVDVTLEELDGPTDDQKIYQYVVKDTGIGMSEEFQKHMFEEFSREENSTISGVQGTGLGLPLALKLSQLLGGKITCVSKQGVGSTFTISFPFKVVENETIIDYEEAIKEKSVDFKDKKVLIVEDNVLNREIALDIIEEAGMIGETAENGQIAVDLLKEKGPSYYDIILMDIQMPVMNGYEATEAIRELYPNEKIIIIAVSANAFAEDKMASIEAGMNDHVAKPINIQELKKVMVKYLK